MTVPPSETNPDAGLLTQLAQRLDDEVSSALRGATSVALVNFPNHNNPGDSAIWLGAVASLRRLNVDVRYRCAWCTYSPEAMRRSHPDGPILINGGGNFGDLYKGQQGLRERLLKQAKGRPLVQLPQSIHFRKQANLQRVQRLISDHGDVTLMLREKSSEQFAREHFDARVVLAPDAALGMAPLARPTGDPLADVLWLHRLPTDPEYVDHGTVDTPLSVRELEWLEADPNEAAWSRRTAAARWVNERLLARARRDPRWARHAWRPLGATFAPLGDGYIDRGLGLLTQGRVLVTDKLHGHLLALLAGIPHVALDNSYGKVSGVYSTWTHPSTLTHWAEDGAEAMTLAGKLLAGRSR